MTTIVKYSSEDIQTIVSAACRAVERRDRFLVSEADVSEWAVAHRLAVYLEEPFRGYNVDCEYNRMADSDGTYSMRSPKRVHGTQKQRPDIVVHKRGPNPESNLLVIEMKKSHSDTDREFLEAMIRDPNFHYKFACQVLIDNGKLIPTLIE